MTVSSLRDSDVDISARILFSTYQTMIGHLDKDAKTFSLGRFDLIIIDEAHRSVFGKYGAIFEYFDGLLLGLTATPRDEVDRFTYDLFGMEQGEPTDSYEYDEAVADGYLKPFRAIKDNSKILTEGIDVALANNAMAVPILQNVFSMEKMPLLSEIPLDKTIGEDEYKKELKRLQNRLGELHNRLYRKKVPVIIAYEGWDAAGKGGNIKRITGALDPRGYEVHPIASPEPHEKARHYLWRFWTRLPKTGHIAIFDRTWYGRVMVERLEGFCSENDWKRAYNEINEFEKELHDWGAVIIKFWVQIDKDTQLERFNERQNTPQKQWKITDEDWRNREKWDQYEDAVNEMIQKTSTTYAPWHILESVDKRYARIKALKIVIEELEKVLE